MWLGEQITNRGIGNGISLIIFIGIVARLPDAVIGEVQQLLAGTRHPLVEVLVLSCCDWNDCIYSLNDPGDEKNSNSDS